MPNSPELTPSKARSLGTDLNNQIQSAKVPVWEILEEQFGGAPPVNPQDLLDEGRGYSSNANFMGLNRRVSSSTDQFYSLIFGANLPVSFTTIYGEAWERGRLMDEWARRYRELLSNWSNYQNQCLLYLRQRSIKGYGPIYWPNQNSWQFKAIRSERLLVPENSSIDPNDWRIFAIADTIKIHELNRIAKDSDDSGLFDGWKKENVRKAVKAYISTNNLDNEAVQPGDTQEYYNAMEDDLFNRSFDSQGDVRVLQVYARDNEGKLFHYTLTIDDAAIDSTDSEGQGFLFKKDLGRIDVTDVVQLMPWQTEFELSEVVGLAEALSPMCFAEDILLNSAINAASLNSALTLKGTAPGADESISNLVIDWDFIYIPDELDIAETKFSATDYPIKLASHISSIGDESGRRFGGAGDIQQSDRQTLGEYNGRMAQAVSISKPQRDFFANQERLKHQTMMGKIIKVTSDPAMLEIILGDDIPMIEGMEVTAPGSIALSRALRLYLINGGVVEALNFIDVGAMTASLPPTLQELMMNEARIQRRGGEALKEFDRMFVSMSLGPEIADRFYPDVMDPLNQQHAQKAQMEHASFALGMFIVPSELDEHVTHLTTHLGRMSSVIEGYMKNEGNIQLEQASKILQESVALYQHCMSSDPEAVGHARYIEMSNNPNTQAIAKQLLEQFGAMYGIIQKIDARVREESEAAQQQALEQAMTPQYDPVQQAKVQREIQGMELALAESQTKQTIWIQEAKAKQEIKLDDHGINQRISETDARMNETKLQIEQQKASLQQMSGVQGATNESVQ